MLCANQKFTQVPTLIDIPQDQSHFTHDELSQIIYQLLEGVHYMHRAGLIHRVRRLFYTLLAIQDLKLTNVAVDRKTLRVTIRDMGFARRVDKNAKLTGKVGTQIYNPPELLFEPEEDREHGQYDKRGKQRVSPNLF